MRITRIADGFKMAFRSFRTINANRIMPIITNKGFILSPLALVGTTSIHASRRFGIFARELLFRVTVSKHSI